MFHKSPITIPAGYSEVALPPYLQVAASQQTAAKNKFSRRGAEAQRTAISKLVTSGMLDRHCLHDTLHRPPLFLCATAPLRESHAHTSRLLRSHHFTLGLWSRHSGAISAMRVTPVPQSKILLLRSRTVLSPRDC